MVQRTNSFVILGTLNDKIDIEVPGIGQGFKKIYTPPKSGENQGIDTFKHDVGQVAEGLAVAVTGELKFKHTNTRCFEQKPNVFRSRRNFIPHKICGFWFPTLCRRKTSSCNCVSTG